MRGKLFCRIAIVTLILMIISSIGLAFDWRRVLSVAKKGNNSLPPLQIVLVFDFSSIPCREPNGYHFSSPITRIAYSQMYEILDEMNEDPNLRVVLAFSSDYINSVREYSVDGIDDYLRKGSSVDIGRYIPEGTSKPVNIAEWNYIWLPNSLKKTFSVNSSVDSYTSIYRMIASSLIGKLIALYSDKRVFVAAMPYSEAPLGLLLNYTEKEWVNLNVESSIKNLKSVFGNVFTFYPPLLDVSGEVLKILKDNGIIWTFSSCFSASEPIISQGVRVIGVDVSLSEGIKNIRTEEELSKWLSQLHSLQRRGKKAFALVIDAHWWFFKSYDFKKSFLKLLSNDKYIKIVLPPDLKYKAVEKFMGSSEVGDIASWVKSKDRIHLWKLFKTLFSYFESHKKFLRDSEKREFILNTSMILNERFLYLASSESEIRKDIFPCIDALSKRSMVILGEDPTKLPSIENIMQRSMYINVLEEKPLNVNGVEDEGYWSFAKEIKGRKLVNYVKIVGLNNYLALSIKLKGKAKDYIGKSYCLSIEVEDRIYKIFFKLWDGRIIVYRKNGGIAVLEKIEEMKVSVWDVVEFYANVSKYPIKFKVELDDLRKDVIIESVPENKIELINSSGR